MRLSIPLLVCKNNQGERCFLGTIFVSKTLDRDVMNEWLNENSIMDLICDDSSSFAITTVEVKRKKARFFYVYVDNKNMIVESDRDVFIEKTKEGEIDREPEECMIRLTY
jgi:hypothetical protein